MESNCFLILWMELMRDTLVKRGKIEKVARRRGRSWRGRNQIKIIIES
jgi:hypothetical protein